MKKSLLVLAVAVFSIFAFSKHSDAQAMGHDYRLGLGVKVGYWGGAAIDAKYFFRSDRAIEGILGFGSDWFTITGLYEFHGPISGAPGLKWYAGPGAHIGFWNSGYHDADGAFFGIDGVLGLDYKFNNAPIDLSIDIQPAISIPNGGFDLWGGLGIRFAL
ncbi:MAG TPA: hypothetical protein VK084_01025 [Chitinophagaceae bacterium]|nr:hypothetical protein [Chitinophagaceae bacterium]